MSRCLTATQVSVVLSLNIVVRDDHRGQLFWPVPLLALTNLFLLFWQIWRVVEGVRLDLLVLGTSILQTIDLWVKVAEISVSAVKFGIG